MRGSRLRLALVAATSVHVLAFAGLGRLRGRAVVQVSPPPRADELFVVSEEPAASEPATAAPAEAAARAPRSIGAALSPAGPAPPRAEEAPPPPAPPAGSAEAWSFGRAAPMDLGVGSYWKSVALSATATATASAPAARDAAEPAASTPSPARILRDGLAARDQELGLGRSGPLVTAAHEAASAAGAPDEGAATLEIESDALGRVVGARVIAAARDVAAWSTVARALVTQMSARVVRVPPGARGLRTRLRIEAARLLPSGERVKPHAGAVPDDVPGGDQVCEGTGASRRCVAGMPAGATGTAFDVADIGARRSRIVHVQVLGEVAL